MESNKRVISKQRMWKYRDGLRKTWHTSITTEGIRPETWTRKGQRSLGMRLCKPVKIGFRSFEGSHIITYVSQLVCIFSEPFFESENIISSNIPSIGHCVAEKSQTTEKCDTYFERREGQIWERLAWINLKYSRDRTFLLQNISDIKRTNRERKVVAMCLSCFYYIHIQVAEFTPRYTHIDFYTWSGMA